MLCVKTGMRNEYDIAKRFASSDTLVLTGIQTVDDLQKNVPKTCRAIMSFGMSGGLRPRLPIVGQTVIASYLVGPNREVYLADSQWHKRLFARTGYFVHEYYSSGQFNQANTPEQRAALYKETGAYCIDDESLWVARFAQQRGIPFAIMRNVSDAWNDDVSITSNILTADGKADIPAVLGDLVKDPIAMEAITYHFLVSQEGLERAARAVGPSFGWEGE